MIKRLELKNFTAFKDIAIDFSPKINVIIGENGTGKTHLLKIIHTLYSPTSLNRAKVILDGSPVAEIMTYHLLNIFRPLERKVGKLYHRGATGNAMFKGVFQNDEKLESEFKINSKILQSIKEKEYEFVEEQSIFIPAKEMLSFMEGFISLYQTYKLAFDETYYDLCAALDHPPLWPDNLSEKAKWVIGEIEKIYDGHFQFGGGGRVTFVANQSKIEYSANVVAEGFRKIGTLVRLLETGAIRPGMSGPLLWDEPEANLNPKLLKLLVQTLIELSRNGQQIILATHDYVLLKWFDLLADRDKDDHVRFHSLYRDADTFEIKIASTENYLKITPNPIDEAFGLLINQEIENDMGDLGK
ncbi:MAG: AAA family ATPase [Desulfovibrio sp.]|jgi:AAA15 family ATPase/GTPase|nr:AAA family ATPase [Desulfovibrio sp.]